MLGACAGLLALLLSLERADQQKPPPPKPAPAVERWTGSVNLGITVTRGNRDTATVNAGFDLKYDRKTGNVFKAEGRFIRGTADGDVSASRISLLAREEHQATGRFFVFAQAQALRDRIKAVEYLAAPTAGVGLKIADSQATKFSVNLGIGGVWEQNAGRDLKRSGALTADEKLSHALSPTVTLTQSIAALWKTEDLRDALFTGTIGLTAAINTRTQIKVEVIDLYKTRQTAIGVRKNDVSLIVALGIKH
jgi:putative salt-induced outer membrane protein YdiY